MKHLIRLAVLFTLLFAAVPAAAQQATQQALTVTATNRTAAQAERGDDRARPGDVVRYRLTFTNITRAPVRGVTLANPLAAGMRFVGGSAQADRNDARLEYSADGGRTFSAQPMEEVVVDGQRVQRAVPAERYTHVRWTVDGSVAPGATVVAEFEARVGAGNPAPAQRGR
jgi:uncharacterized repeat protein (TIGR01451 family)